MNRDPAAKSVLADLKRPAFWWVWAWPMLVAAGVFVATRPGYLSFDSALIFWQARHDQYFDIGGPLLPWLWHRLLWLGEGTDAIRALLIGSIALGLSAYWWQSRPVLPGWRLLLAAGLAPLCPLLWVLWPHVWTDVLLAGLMLWLAMLCGEAMGAQSNRSALIVRLLLVVMLSIAVCLTRHNGILALPPFWWAILAAVPLLRSTWRRLLAVVLTLVIVTTTAGWIRQSWVPQRLDTWAVTLLWDLQAVSVATRPDDAVSRIPASLTGPNLRVGELRAAYLQYSATSLFANTTSGVANPTVAPLTAEQADDLRSAWRSILSEPSYWQHRGRVFAMLVGAHQSPELRGLAEAPGVAQFADNPPLPDAPPQWHRLFRNIVDGVFALGLAAPGLYGVLLAALLAWRWRSLDSEIRSKVWPLLASALGYALPLSLIAPSAETRYLLWPVLASWLASLIIACGARIASHRRTTQI